MASTIKHLRSSTADKRPVASGLADGQFAINTASGTPAVFFKDSNGGVVKVGPAHVGASAPNAVPAGSAGNSLGELWVNNSLTTPGLNYYTGSAFVNLTPSGTTTTVGLVELATPAETQAGTDAVRAVTPSGLQSKVSDSTSTTSSTTIASSTAVKSAYDLANAALPKAGGTVTGELLIGTTGSLVFEGSSDDSFETTIAVTNPTADHTITFPNVTGTVVTTGDTGTVTSTMIANDTIVNADINSAAAIVDTKLATISTADKVSVSALNIDGATDIGGALENGDLFIVDDGAGGTNRKAPAFRMAQLTYSGVTGDITIASGGTSAIGTGVIVDADVNASAAIAGTKISPDFGSQTITTTGVVSAALGAAATPSITFTGDLNTGIYSPGADQVAVATNGTGRLFVDASGRIIIGAATAAIGNSLEIVSNTSGLAVGVRGRSADNVGIIGFYPNNSSTEYARIQSNGDSSLSFGTGSSGSERLRITSAGLVGIGTSSPGAKLDVSGSGNLVRLGDGTNTFDVRFQGPNNWSTQLDTSADKFNIQRNSTSLVTVDSAGRLGIGTTSPSSLLHLGAASGTIQMQFNNGGTSSYIGHDSGFTGLDLAAGGGIKFRYYTGTVFAEAARVDTSGRLLVGTSSASDNNALLKVQGNVGGSTGTGWIDLRRGLTTPGANSQLGLLSFSDASGSHYAFIEGFTDATTGTNDYPGRLVFSVTADGASSPTERMRITSTGTTTVFATTANVIGATSNQAAGTIYYLFYGANNASSTTTGTTCFLVYTNGNVQNTNNSYAGISDAKLKENIVDAASQWSDIKALQVRKYNFKEGQTHTQIGLVAQEVELVSPGLVTESPDRDEDGNDLGTVTKSVNYSVLYMKAVKALQEAMERIEQLEQRLTDAGIA